MKLLKTGQFHGLTTTTILLDGITLTDTEYTLPKVDWHYHENAYLTFILQGKVIEGNKKEIFHCTTGSLLYHYLQEPHYNIKPNGFTRGFHIEINKAWFDNFLFDNHLLQGSINISNPEIKFLMYKLFKESKAKDDLSSLTIPSLLIQVLSKLNRHQSLYLSKKPIWVNKIVEILNEQYTQTLSLDYLVKSLDIHPVHLSRYFPKYFNCTLGEYIRKIRIEKSLIMMPNSIQSLTDIAFACGFADQSHFSRCFKEIMNITPFAYRRALLS